MLCELPKRADATYSDSSTMNFSPSMGVLRPLKGRSSVARFIRRGGSQRELTPEAAGSVIKIAMPHTLSLCCYRSRHLVGNHPELVIREGVASIPELGCQGAPADRPATRGGGLD